MNEEIMQKQLAAAQEDARCAWVNNGILERARQAQDKTIADLRKRHELFVRQVRDEAEFIAKYADQFLAAGQTARDVIAMCDAELSGE